MSNCAQRLYQNSGNYPLLDMLPKGGGRILDCGCGAGDNARVLKSRGWAVTGITISPSERQQASAYCDWTCQADLEQGLPKDLAGGFDVVLMSHVLEHLVCPEKLLRDVHQVLVSGGGIAVALPNVLAYSQRLRFLLGKFEYTSGGLMDETHVHFYTFTTGAKLLEASGYKVVVACADGAFPLWKVRGILPAHWVKNVNHWACRWRPGLFGNQSLYLATPRDHTMR